MLSCGHDDEGCVSLVDEPPRSSIPRRQRSRQGCLAALRISGPPARSATRISRVLIPTGGLRVSALSGICGKKERTTSVIISSPFLNGISGIKYMFPPTRSRSCLLRPTPTKGCIQSSPGRYCSISRTGTNYWPRSTCGARLRCGSH